MGRSAARAAPLLDWPELKAAEDGCAEAQEAWRAARRAYRIAPHGFREDRLRALRGAAQAAVTAALELDEVRTRLGAAG